MGQISWTPDLVMTAAISLLACLIATGCAGMATFFEEEPKTCEEACEHTYIDCLEWAYDTVTDTSIQQGPYNPRHYPPQQTTTTTREVPSKAEEGRCRLDFEGCQRGCLDAEDEADTFSQDPSGRD